MIRRKASVVTLKPAGTRMPSIRDSPPRCAPLPPTTATCISPISRRPNTYCSIIAIPPRQPCSAALHWLVEPPASRALSDLLLGTSSSLVAFPLTSRPAAPASRAARTPAPPRRAPATAPPVPPAVRHHRVPYRSTTTHARRAPRSSSVLGPAEILQHDPGLAASPPVRHTLRVARSEISLPCFWSSAADRHPSREAAARRVRRSTSLAQEDVASAYGCSRGTKSSSSSARPERRRARHRSPGRRRATRALGEARLMDFRRA